MAARLVIQTGYYTPGGGWVNNDPDMAGAQYIVSAITRPYGGGATIESIPQGSWTRAATGFFWAAVTPALYTADTWYEYVVSWTEDGVPMTSPSRPFFFHAAGGVDPTVIGPASIGVAGVTDTTITVSHVPPATVTYSYTQFKAIPVNGGTVVTTTGTGASVAIPGLVAGTRYVVVAIPYSIAGVAGDIGAGSIVEVSTAKAASSDTGIWVKAYIDGALIGSIVFDPTTDRVAHEGQRWELRRRGHLMSVRSESHDPTPFKLRRVTVESRTRDLYPRGARGRA